MTKPEWQKKLEQLTQLDEPAATPGMSPIATHDLFARRGVPYFKPPIDRPYKTTESHDRLQSKFGVLTPESLLDLLRCTEVFVGDGPVSPVFSALKPTAIVLEKPVVCDRYSKANSWRMDGVIEAPGLHVIVEIKTVIDSMGELLGQCQRYMRHYRPAYLQDGEFCPVIVACPVIEPYIIEVLEAQGFYWLANERWDQFFGVRP